MNFQEFVSITRPVIGGKSSAHRFVRTLFEAILTEEAGDVLEDYSDNTYKAYANGRTQITEIAKAISPYVDQAEFIGFLEGFGESALLELSKRFQAYVPGINARNVCEEVADLFADIIREAAGTKRKSTPKGANSDKIILEEEPISEEIPQAEVVDDEMPSGAASELQGTTIIQHQTNVVQNGENNFNLTNNGTMNFNF